ncbi:MAG: OmpA family protein [Bernardetiaceae bacterium]
MLRYYCSLVLCLSCLWADAQGTFARFGNLPKQAVHALYIQDTNRWIATERGLIRLTEGDEKGTFMTQIVSDVPVLSLTFDRRGRRWMGGYRSNLYLENDAGEMVPFDFSHRGKFLIAQLTTDARGQAWAATLGGGLWQINERGQAEFLTTQNSKLQSDQVYAICIDGQQTKWIATDKGLQSLPEDGRWQQHRFLRQATAIHWQNNTLWVAGFDRKWQTVLWKKTGYGDDWQEVVIPKSLQGGRITTIHTDPEGDLWLAGRIIARHQNNRRWETFGSEEGFTSTAALALAVDTQGNVWVGTEGEGLLAQIQYPPESSVAPTSGPKTLAEVLENDRLSPAWLNQEIRIQVQFLQSKDQLLPEYFPEIDRLANILQKFPRLNIELAGHTDNRGQAYLNQQLSYRRAEAVKDYLVQQRGIARERVQTVGYGGSRPVADNDREETRRLNRRVTVRFLE